MREPIGNRFLMMHRRRPGVRSQSTHPIPRPLWIGGGESNIFRSSMAGPGVFRSDDAGKTWKHMGLADTHHIARIVVHPRDSNTVFVAAGGHEYTPNDERGVFKTTDGGQTWKKVLFENDLVGANGLVNRSEQPGQCVRLDVVSNSPTVVGSTARARRWNLQIDRWRRNLGAKNGRASAS